MDEDIDIEEHDVLDNPKIRNIFPDLSLVKIEPPDVDIQDQYEVPIKYQPEGDGQIRVKIETQSEDEQDFTLTYEQSNESDNSRHYENSVNTHFEQSEHAACDYMQNRQISQNIVDFKEDAASIEGYSNYQCKNQNRIILGSKPVPCLDYEKLYEEAWHSKTNVVLENWDNKLKNSPCYCQNCEILFATVNALDAHKSISHSLLVARESSTIDTQTKSTARKSTVKSAYCDHCNRTFPDHTSVIKHLYKLLPLKEFKIPTPTPVKIEAKFPQYKCTKCKIYFKSFSDGTEHKKKCHPNFKISNIICKVQRFEEPHVSQNFDGNNTTRKIQTKGKLVANSSLVPRSVLFQCNICFVGFLSCYSAMQHAKTCEKRTEFVQCNICKRNIRRLDFSTHLLQHNYNDKLRIYTLNKNLTQKIIAKCPTCAVCFDETLFWYHQKTCDGKKIDYIHCNICSLDIKTFRYSNHKSLHTMKKYTKKDFILVEFFDKIKPKNISNVVESERSKIPLYFCGTCGTYKTLRSLKGHKNGACKSLTVKFCDTCGLGFGKQHYRLHRLTHERMDLRINDFDIFSLCTGKKVDPPIPEFHRCNNCQIHFLFKIILASHDCETEKFKVCKLCNKKFNLLAFTPHMNFHYYKGQNLEPEMDMPELLKMYDSINTKWDIVYKCMNCKVITVTYDSAVEHSQNHVYGSTKSAYKTCEKCTFNIAEKDFAMHNDLHKNNSNINRKQFRVLKFNYKDLYKKKWMDIFLPLPNQDKYQILAKSIYRCTRRFKLNCEINCFTDDAKFYCKTCKSNVNIEDMKKHYFDQLCQYSSNYVCSFCNATFKTIRQCVTHEIKHENLSKPYKVYSFNDDNDKEFNQKLLDFDSSSYVKSTMKPRAIASKSALKKFARKPQIVAVGNNNKFKIYKCERCQSCVSIGKNMAKHKCNTRKKACYICKNYFFPRNLTRHIDLHRFYGKKPTIVYFSPDKNETVPKAIIYKCECSLHFTSKQSIEKHLSVCSDDLDISKESCSKCHLLFPTDLLVTHLCKHHSKVTSIEIIETSKIGNFKCGKCNIIYPNMITFDDHLFKCPLKTGKKCNRCNLKFDMKMFKHRCGSSQVIVVTKSVIATKLLKCSQCDLHYFNSKSLLYHIEQKHVCHRKIVACDICNLRFTEFGISKHMMIHRHKEQHYIIKIEDGAGSYEIIKGQNNSSNKKSKVVVIGKSSDKTNISEDNSLDSSIKVMNDEFVQKSSVERKVETVQSTIESTPTKSIASSIVYKCSLCDICYLFRKSWHYHIKANHITKRAVIPCKVCGLRFTQNSLSKHFPIHKSFDNYSIQVIDTEASVSTVVKGKNKARVKPSFRDDSHLRKKTKRADDCEESSTSKLNFESIHMTDAEGSERIPTDFLDETSNDFNEIDALVDSTEVILPGIVENDTIDIRKKDKSPKASTVISSKLKSLINANIDRYTDTIYKCQLCSICFLTQQASSSHLKRTSHRAPPKFTKCNVCGLAFTHLTLLRHKYIHHEKMKFNLESFNVIIFSSNTFKMGPNNMSIDIYDTEKDTQEADITQEVGDVIDKNTEEVDMDIDEDIHTQIQSADCNNRSIIQSKSHENSETKMSIKCRICNYQFQLMETVDSIRSHVMVEHNKKFCLEDMITTEYSLSNDRMDKVQSRLISTTVTDVTTELGANMSLSI